jgi:hypothetical protein
MYMNRPSAHTIKATDLQLHIGSLYYPILLQLANEKAVITYKELIEKVQALNPNDEAIKNMIPFGSGNVLSVLYHFADINNQPRITTLAMKKGSQCGDGIETTHDCPAERDLCFAFDWSVEQSRFWDFIAKSKAADAARRAHRNFEHASDKAWAYYLINKSQLTSQARIAIEKIINSLRTGIKVWINCQLT